MYRYLETVVITETERLQITFECAWLGEVIVYVVLLYLLHHAPQYSLAFVRPEVEVCTRCCAQSDVTKLTSYHMRVPSRLKDKALGLLLFFSRFGVGGFLSAQPELSAELLAPLLDYPKSGGCSTYLCRAGDTSQHKHVQCGECRSLGLPCWLPRTRSTCPLALWRFSYA